jgi:hypothetical protein
MNLKDLNDIDLAILTQHLTMISLKPFKKPSLLIVTSEQLLTQLHLDKVCATDPVTELKGYSYTFQIFQPKVRTAASSVPKILRWNHIILQ